MNSLTPEQDERLAILIALEKLVEVAASLALDFAIANKQPLSYNHFTELLESVREAKRRLYGSSSRW